MKLRNIVLILVVILLIVGLIWFLYHRQQVAISQSQSDGYTDNESVEHVVSTDEGVSESFGDGAAAGVAGNESSADAVTEILASKPWLEMPYDEMEGDDIHKVTHWAEMDGKMQRNYSICYDEDVFASYWVAYPLCESHLTTGRAESWGYDDKVSVGDQTNVSKGYGASMSTANYPKNFYARGHQIPNADRNAVPQMQAQTYYSTNMTPQIQNGFNGGVWAKLEAGVRNEVPQNDTLYIITGASFEKVGKPEDVKTIINKNDSKTLPVPNYYWKAVLKVKRAADGSILEAQSIGFWLPHDDLKGHSFTEYAVTVDSIEYWTGINLFVNLPDTIEVTAEANDSWSAFQTF